MGVGWAESKRANSLSCWKQAVSCLREPRVLPCQLTTKFRDTLRAGQATKSTSLPCHRPLGAPEVRRRIVVALTEQGNRYSSSHSCWRRLVTGKGVATAKGGAIGREGATQYSVEQRCTRRLQIMLPTTRHCCAGHHVFEWASVKVVTHSSTKVERLGAKPSNVSGLWLIFSGSSYSVSSMLQKVKGRGGQGEGSMGWRFQIRCTRGLCHKQRSAAMQRSQG